MTHNFKIETANYIYDCDYNERIGKYYVSKSSKRTGKYLGEATISADSELGMKREVLSDNYTFVK
jgi:hypothetical protein